MADLVTRPQLDLLTEAHRTDSDSSALLHSLASLTSHSVIKHCLLSRLLTSDSYSSILPYYNSCEPKVLETHLLPLTLLYQQLCDNSTTMSGDDSELLEGVPPKDLLVPVVEGVTRILSLGASLEFDQLEHILVTANGLLSHDYGFNLLRNALEKGKLSLKPVVAKINSALSSGDCDQSFPSLIQLIDFIYNLLSAVPKLRNCVMSAREVSNLLAWHGERIDCGDDEENICSRDLFSQMVFENLTIPDDAIWHLYRRVEDLSSLLDGKSDSADTTVEASPHTGCCGLHFNDHFDDRLVFTSPSESADWLESPPLLYGGEEAKETESELPAVNLSDLMKKYCAADYDFEGAVKDLLSARQKCHSTTPQKDSSSGPSGGLQRRAMGGEGPRGHLNGGRSGRGYSFDRRGANLRSDPFRCRPPNTSRPPSLHVDDFVALESTGHQPTGPTGYNRISFGRGKMILDSMRGGRGRGGMRGVDMRGGGAFMYGNRPFRGDFGRGMRGGRWNSFRGGPPGGMRFMRGRSNYRAMVRGGRGGQFH